MPLEDLILLSEIADAAVCENVALFMVSNTSTLLYSLGVELTCLGTVSLAVINRGLEAFLTVMLNVGQCSSPKWHAGDCQCSP